MRWVNVTSTKRSARREGSWRLTDLEGCLNGEAKRKKGHKAHKLSYEGTNPSKFYGLVSSRPFRRRPFNWAEVTTTPNSTKLELVEIVIYYWRCRCSRSPSFLERVSSSRGSQQGCRSCIIRTVVLGNWVYIRKFTCTLDDSLRHCTLAGHGNSHLEREMDVYAVQYLQVGFVDSSVGKPNQILNYCYGLSPLRPLPEPPREKRRSGQMLSRSMHTDTDAEVNGKASCSHCFYHRRWGLCSSTSLRRIHDPRGRWEREKNQKTTVEPTESREPFIKLRWFSLWDLRSLKEQHWCRCRNPTETNGSYVFMLILQLLLGLVIQVSWHVP